MGPDGLRKKEKGGWKSYVWGRGIECRVRIPEYGVHIWTFLNNRRGIIGNGKIGTRLNKY